MKRIIHGLWHDTGTAIELASLKDECITGTRVRVVGRTAKGALFGYEMDGADGSEPMSEAMVRFPTVGSAVAWMGKQGFTAESIASAFPDALRDARPDRLAHTDGVGTTDAFFPDLHPQRLGWRRPAGAGAERAT